MQLRRHVCVHPIDLGWHLAARPTSRATCRCMRPPGRYVAGGSENTGKGMWTYEPFRGGDRLPSTRKKLLSLAADRFLGVAREQEGTDIQVGQILTLEGGLGKSYLGGGLIVGAAATPSGRSRPTSLGKALPSGRRDRRPGALEHQAQGLRPRAGRDPPDRDQEEAVRARERPVLLGDGRSEQDARADAHHHGDVPDPEREALGVARAADEYGMDLIVKRARPDGPRRKGEEKHETTQSDAGRPRGRGRGGSGPRAAGPRRRARGDRRPPGHGGVPAHPQVLPGRRRHHRRGRARRRPEDPVLGDDVDPRPDAGRPARRGGERPPRAHVPLRREELHPVREAAQLLRRFPPRRRSVS